MTTYIALLRGINVGKVQIKMADLRTYFAAAGCRDVTTYIQSGNVVFGDETRPRDELKSNIEQHIETGAGAAVPVVLRTAAEWSAVVDGNPYPEAEPTRLHVAYLDGDPVPDAAQILQQAAVGAEEAVVAGREVYMHLPDGMGRAKLPTGLAKVGVPVTVRNWNTVLKLQEMSS